MGCDACTKSLVLATLVWLEVRIEVLFDQQEKLLDDCIFSVTPGVEFPTEIDQLCHRLLKEEGVIDLDVEGELSSPLKG